MTDQPHNQEFIEEMKMRLEEEKGQLERELGRTAHKDGEDYEANFPEYGRNDEENAAEIADYSAMYSTTEAAEQRLREVSNALERIKDGTYGVTDEGEVIPEARLRANPAATTLVTRNS